MKKEKNQYGFMIYGRCWNWWDLRWTLNNYTEIEKYNRWSSHTS